MYTMWSVVRPARRKYACSGMQHDATGLFNRGSGPPTRAWAAACPPNARSGDPGVAPAGEDVAVDAVQREFFEESTVRRRAVAEIHNGHGVQAIRGQGLLAGGDE